MLRKLCFAMGVVVLATASGCGNGIKEETIEVKASNDPLHEPRSILERYSKGQAPGSEVANFPQMVARVKEVDPERGAILGEGLDKIAKASKGERVKLSKELLAKIQPSGGYPEKQE